MKMIDRLRVGAQFRPSAELVRACETLFLARARADLIRPIVNAYQAKILEDGSYRMEAKSESRILDRLEQEGVKLEHGSQPWSGAKLTIGADNEKKLWVIEPRISYLLADADAKRYFAACRRAAEKAKLKVSHPDNCPLLEAEHLQIKAENCLLGVFADEMEDESFRSPTLMEHRKQLLDIIGRLVGPYVADADQILQRVLGEGEDGTPLELTGADVRSLMRKHGWTIRGIAEKFGLTQKRVREVRASGVTGFLADEWHYMVTGRWLTERAGAR